MAIKKIIEIEVHDNLNKTQQSLKGVEVGLKNVGTQTMEMGSKMSGLDKAKSTIDGIGNAVSGLNPAFGGAIKGANGLILKMWEMAANPIGAILAGIVITMKFLYEAFQSSVAGGKELKAIFAGISAVGEQVKDAMFGLGRALINVASAAYKFITLDFKGAAEDMKKANQEATESYKQLGDAVDGTTFKIIKNLEKQQQANDKAKKIQAVVQSETNKLLVQSREILTDETASIKEKKKALEEVTKAEKLSSAEKVRIAAEDLRIATEKAKAIGGEAEKKAKKELRELTISLNEAETENAMTGIKLNKQRKMLLRQETADQKEADDARKTALKEKQDAEKLLIDEKLKDTKLSFQQQRDLVNNDNALSLKDKTDFIKKINDEEKKSIENHKKEIEALNKKYATDLENLLAKTEQQKLDLQKSRDLLEIEQVAKTEEEKAKLKLALKSKYDILQAELTAKLEKEKIDKEDAQWLKLQELTMSKSEYDKLVLTQKYEKEFIAAEGNAALQKELKKNLEKDIKVIDDKSAEDKKVTEQALLNAKLAFAQQGLSLVAEIAGKGSKIGKAIAVAQATMSGIEGVQNAYTTAQKSPITAGFPAYPIVQASLAGVFSALQIKKILSTNVGSSPSASSSASSGGSGGGSPQFNLVGQSSTNQLASTIANQQNKPLQTYVVGNQITTQQSLDRNAVQTSTFG